MFCNANMLRAACILTNFRYFILLLLRFTLLLSTYNVHYNELRLKGYVFCFLIKHNTHMHISKLKGLTRVIGWCNSPACPNWLQKIFPFLKFGEFFLRRTVAFVSPISNHEIALKRIFEASLNWRNSKKKTLETLE